ncbi:unnamed protein product [Closterium sp. NIES-54]
MWGPARVSGLGRERYFRLVVDDYTRYTTVFPLRSKGEVPDVLIPWIRAVRLQLRERFRQDLPVLRLHSDRGGEFSSDLLRDFCHGEGITQSFTLPASPQQNGIAERCIGFVMEVARTSMIHAAAPHFLWPFAVLYAAHQLNLWPRVSLPETSPTLRWKGEVSDASVFRVYGSRAFVRDTSADKLSARAIPCVFLGFVPDAPGWQFYHPTLRRVLLSQDVTFDESVPFYRLFPYRSTAPAALPCSRSSSGAGRGAASGGVEPGGGAKPGGAEPGGAEPAGVEPGGAESEGVESGGDEPRGAVSSGGPVVSLPEPLSPQKLREWLVRRARLGSGAAGARDTGAGGTRVAAGASGGGGPAAAGPGGACARGAGAAEPGCAGAGAVGPGAGGGGTGAGGAGAGAGDPGVGSVVSGGTSAGGTLRPRRASFLVSRLLLASPPPVPSPYAEQTEGLTERHEPASHPTSPVCPIRRASRPHPPPVPGTHAMALCPSSVPLRIPLPPPPESSLPTVPGPESDLVHAASPTVSRLLATVVSDPSFELAVASALFAELVDFAAACRLDYATAVVTESEFASPLSVRGECALGTDILEDRQEDFECLAAAIPCFASMLLAPERDPDAPNIPTPRSYAEAITSPYSSQWQAAMDAEMASWKSTGTYVDAFPSSWANIVDGMWIFRVKRQPGSPPAFKARYVARGFSQRQGVDYFQTFSPTPKMTTLQVLLHVVAQRD